jgi:hypothetical protein
MSIAKCQRCYGQSKLYSISAKCSDMYSHVNLKSGKEYEGYVPDWIGEYGDYVSFTLCRHCGQIQGEWPYFNPESNQFKHGRVAK